MVIVPSRLRLMWPCPARGMCVQNYCTAHERVLQVPPDPTCVAGVSVRLQLNLLPQDTRCSFACHRLIAWVTGAPRHRSCSATAAHTCSLPLLFAFAVRCPLATSCPFSRRCCASWGAVASFQGAHAIRRLNPPAVGALRVYRLQLRGTRVVELLLGSCHTLAPTWVAVRRAVTFTSGPRGCN